MNKALQDQSHSIYAISKEEFKSYLPVTSKLDWPPNLFMQYIRHVALLCTDIL